MSETHIPDFTGDRIKHLEMIQTVISRLAGNSAAMKRYCLVLVAVGVGAFKAMGQPLVIPALAFMVIVFWLLDARYLQHEICFRAVHDEVREEPPDQRPDFRLSPTRNKASLCRGLFSWSTAFLYPSLLVFLLLFRSLLP